VLVGIGLLVVFTPLFFGSVHPWAYSLMEQVSFALVVTWIVKAWLDGGRLLRPGGRAAAAAVVVPMAVLLGLLAFETVRLPPGLLARLSPDTYQLYAEVLPGWPTHASYRNIDFNASPPAPSGPVILPTARQVRAGVTVPFAPSASIAHGHAAITKGGAPQVKAAMPDSKTASSAHSGAAGKSAGTTGHGKESSAGAAPVHAMPPAQIASARTAGVAGGAANQGAAGSALPPSTSTLGWRALSFEPAVTRAVLLKGLAYAAIFLLVALYPFGAPGEPRSEKHFCRALLAVVLITGLVIAFVGLVNWATWNGRILWFFVPLDWGGPQFETLRASGPFIDPDHFANYLAMIFPFALAGVLFRTDMVSRRWATLLRLGSVLVAFIIVCALILSLSRGGWAATAFGVTLLIAMFFRQPEKRRAVFARHSNARTLKWAAVGALALFVLALLFVGPQGRSLSAARLNPGAGRLTITQRTVLWHGSLAMTRDFPAFGVGLGAWGELFTRYAPRPWSQFFFYREAHNDYLQFVAEAGFLAMLVLIWLAWRILRRIAAGLRAGDSRQWPLMAAVVAASGAMALHETVDFSLQVPANAMLLAILLGLGLRAATSPAPGDEIRRKRMPRLVLALAAGAALALIFATIGQHDIYYPDFLPKATTLRTAVARVDEHPADSQGHFILAHLGEGVITPQAQLRELRSAVWLDPANPLKRDAYASMLAKRGKLKLAEAEVTRSVFNSPSPSTHFYLSPELVHWLAPATRVAVERGFNEAIAERVPGALNGLGDFYALSDRPLQEAQLDSAAASRTKDSLRRVHLLLGAGQAYARAGYMTVADALFQAAMDEAPNNPDPCLDLVRTVYGPDRDMRSAKAIIDNAIKSGQDPYQFNLVLAGAARQAQNPRIEEAALKSALAVIPDDINVITALGEFYLDQRRYDDALMTLEPAVEANPDSARLRFALGRAQEHSYHYYEAEQSYARAVALAPENRGWARYYAEFKQRMVKEAAQLDGAGASEAAAVSKPAAAPTPATEN
jgi:O-antigen ligase/tetratricopeptide (TPR) repeat protein